MKKKMKYFLVLLVLLFLSMSVVNASDNTTDLTDHTLEKTTTQHVDKVVTSTQEEIQKEDNNINTTVKEKQINKKSTTQNTKTATPIEISDYTTLHNRLISDLSSDDVTIDIKANITLGGSTTVNSAIKTLTINGNDFTIDGNGQYQFLNIQSGTSVNINNITITNCKASYGGAIYVGGNLSCNNCNFINNTANYGGAI